MKHIPAPILPGLRLAALVLLAGGASPLVCAAPAEASAPAAAAAADLPTDSVYQVSVPLTDQLGRKTQLAERRGQPMLISMFYTSCKFVCPMLIDALQDTAARLSTEDRARLSVLLVSFDPAHDTVAVLKRTADQRKLDGSHWTLARTDARSVRKLAATLGIQYRALPDGDFNHTTALILLDADGRIVGRTAQLGNADPAFVKLVQGATQRALR
jgi:protein SCO1/2